MTPQTFFSANVLLAWSAYLVGTASPGPSNLAIMSIASTSGRRAALAFAMGVTSGSLTWAVLAALGLSAALTAYSGFLTALKIGGGVYLLWLASKSAWSAWRPTASGASRHVPQHSARRLYARGALLHLTNPKAIFVWMSVAALGSSPGKPPMQMLTVVAGCLCIGMSVFSAYAVLFSMSTPRRIYARMQRQFNVCLALAFGAAGIRLLTSRT
ncbi:LysE family translocator [Caballeronia sp. LZ062]|uniref:LysE family translocator n=1 Tax=unclassified Caballeronia TaxID=2646786 RepID=UPI002856872E|nr:MULTISPECIES: LysE family translocator [unclassified Caballeronia]MDR5857710.1 LysE family translocator [Caballeronia sp. LZ050]MDR5869260.1 LysE family translocator [Caballeronia sp. LZ062]